MTVSGPVPPFPYIGLQGSSQGGSLQSLEAGGNSLPHMWVKQLRNSFYQIVIVEKGNLMSNKRHISSEVSELLINEKRGGLFP